MLDTKSNLKLNFASSLYICLFQSHQRSFSAHAGYIGIGRSLLTGYDALLSRLITRDLLHTLSHSHDNTWNGRWRTSGRHWWGQVDHMLTEFTFLKQTYRAGLKPGRPA